MLTVLAKSSHLTLPDAQALRAPTNDSMPATFCRSALHV
jgi:hypothetical protein